VPHIVIIDEDVETADIVGRGSRIRRDRSLRDGANVNFVTPMGSDWAIRTYERGVEAETLACGTGAVATGILLTEWGRAQSPVGLITRSGRRLEVRVRRDGDAWLPSLRGPAEIVFQGELRSF
jgi:diaminopimelate epimerase